MSTILQLRPWVIIILTIPAYRVTCDTIFKIYLILSMITPTSLVSRVSHKKYTIRDYVMIYRKSQINPYNYYQGYCQKNIYSLMEHYLIFVRNILTSPHFLRIFLLWDNTRCDLVYYNFKRGKSS
ncbi:hypothetical protein TTRE_0000845801 [Trichuris trichiura]|uniref:Uncharacterized protein n=1 Tax=Trichuris trichiura TaxID=36087 RepID=A0A077ZN21_TRITR|nr:hypothetical protein TTRE_0000845801 [Trichuris trichiura]